MRACLSLVFILFLAFAGVSAVAQDTSTQDGSLADIARSIRAKKKVETVVNGEDAKQLFKDVESILTFASQHSGFQKRTAVRYKLVGRETVDKFFADAFAESDEAKKIQKSELVLKKFGVLPADFQLQKFAQEKGGEGLAGFYDDRDKTMYLLSWVDVSKQRPVMAHELTHALQDQNYNLKVWRKASRNVNGKSVPDESSESDARIAAIEGQAMLVYFDYMLQPLGTSLAESGDKIEALKSRLLSVYDSPVSFRTAPLIFKEMTTFPYLDGFAFELEILKKAGSAAAFAGVFARPPRDTHEIMHPEDYLSGKRPAAFRMPDLAVTFGESHPLYDSGSVGELDVRTMSKQFGIENDAYSVAAFWDGGAYLAVRKPLAVGKPEADLLASDLALLYVSRWKTPTAAKRFVEIYRAALVKRSHGVQPGSDRPSECEGAACPHRWSIRFDTDDGPVAMELSTDNTLIISQGLDYDLVDQIKQAFKKPSRTKPVENSELMLRLSELPVVHAMRDEFLRSLTAQLPAVHD
jgi:hypothetical protein